ncbi:SWI/SNF complex subunit Sol1 [Schizosaccharomyces octosporus yFS286]|uniref:SWI/SNF complex subunit Sol1 n=1 Tax=Schizosaccharomyces octosporus (strain yFS286) TaxID=483514 RepID=S9R7H0_SCHOY|nr:SWI/SNF complex subunit Sol1 [Schizosaccharomyces octosporus yFS286]EPX74175.1 SWI/SNF complex subunit Sol1 [Schizosaccharomyces octosporus yFS286]
MFDGGYAQKMNLGGSFPETTRTPDLTGQGNSSQFPTTYPSNNYQFLSSSRPQIEGNSGYPEMMSQTRPTATARGFPYGSSSTGEGIPPVPSMRMEESNQFTTTPMASTDMKHPSPSLPPSASAIQQQQQQQLLQRQQYLKNKMESASSMFEPSYQSHPEYPPNTFPTQNMAAASSRSPSIAPDVPNNPSPPSRNKTSTPSDVAENCNKFMVSLLSFMAKRGTPMKDYPSIDGYPINLMMLYALVMRTGGSRRVTDLKLWPKVAASLGFTNPKAVSLLYQNYNECLLPYEEAWTRAHQQKLRLENQPVSEDPRIPTPKQTSVPKATFNAQIPNQKNESPSLSGSSHTPANYKPSLSPTAVPQRSGSIPPNPPVNEKNKPFIVPEASTPLPSASDRPPVEPSVEPRTYNPMKIDLAGITAGFPLHLSTTHRIDESLLRLKMPSISDLGCINIHALSMSLLSTLPGEMTYALNVLLLLANDRQEAVHLAKCEEVLDALVDVGWNCLDVLTEKLASETSENIHVERPSYRYLLLECIQENSIQRNQPNQEYEGCGTYEKKNRQLIEQHLLAVCIILRNMSLAEETIMNFSRGSELFNFLLRLIRLLNRGEWCLLSSKRAMLDLHKDVLLFLSQVSHNIVLPNVESALQILHFILAFSPISKKYTKRKGLVTGDSQDLPLEIPTYTPFTHPYVGPSIAVYAKLMARDATNKLYFQTVFDRNPKLLNLTFLFLASVIPKFNRQCLKLCEKRLPLLQHAFLCLENTVSFLREPSQAVFWCNIGDGFFASLIRLLILLSGHPSLNPVFPPDVPTRTSTNPFRCVIQNGILCARKLYTLACSINATIVSFPKNETILAILLAPTTDRTFLKDLSTILDRDVGEQLSFNNRNFK